jgi:hypothetical protein
MKQMEVVTMDIADLVLADYNPRKWSEDDRAQLRTSLERFGFVDPVIVNTHPKRKNVVVGGHFRLTMWKEMGNSTVPCVMVSLTKQQEKELNIRLNRNTGRFDTDLLLKHFDIPDLLSFGFEKHEIPGAIPPLKDSELEKFFKDNSPPAKRDMVAVTLHFTPDEHALLIKKQEERGVTFEDLLKQSLGV